MNEITLNSNGIANMTAVSNTFIDTYMPSADGSYVKVYLYLLRCLGQPTISISIPHIADKLDNTERDVIRALLYWERSKLITLTRNGDSICGISLNNPECDNSCMHSNQPPSYTNTTNNGNGNNSGGGFNYNNTHKETPVHTDTPAVQQCAKQPDDIATLISPPLEVLMDNPVFAEIISVIESSYVKRPLNPREGEFIADLYCKFQFGSCLIFDLFDECSNKIDPKSSSFIPYMSKVANSWYTKGVDSSLKAKEYTREYLECYTALRKAFGINNRDLSSAELKFINKWHVDNGYNASMIQIACEKCMVCIGKPSLNYTESIMDAWKRNNIRTIEEVETSDKSFKESKKAVQAPTKPNFYNTYTQRSYTEEDYAKLELELLSR